MQCNYDILWGKIALDKNSMEHWFTMKKNNSAIQKTINVWYGQNYGIILKLWYYTKDYEYMIYYGKNMKLLGTLEKSMVLHKKPWNLDLL